MELSKKTQKLSKEQRLTQDQFAERLFVSRSAVSKLETGRGTPSMDFLQQISRLYNITIDELLSAEEVITIAKHEKKENINCFTSYIDSILNLVAIIGLLLPLFKVEDNNMFYSVPLYQFNGWLSVLYWMFTILMGICGCIQILINKITAKKQREV